MTDLNKAAALRFLTSLTAGHYDNYDTELADLTAAFAARALDAANEREACLMGTCEMGHKFGMLADHPERDGVARCPHCMAIGLDAIRLDYERLRSVVDRDAMVYGLGSKHIPLFSGPGSLYGRE